MRLRLPLGAAALLIPALALAPLARAEAIRMVASDERGVTLELALPAYDLGPAGADGRVLLSAPGLKRSGVPDRPTVPSATTLIALPPGARASIGAVTTGAEERRDGVRLVLGDRRGFREGRLGPDGDLIEGPVPFSEPGEPILDGPWPRQPVALGAPFTLRGQRMVAVTLHPFRYDEASGTLTIQRRMQVRIEFAGSLAGGAPGPPRDDRYWDAVFKGAVLNFEQGRRWRAAPTGVRPAPAPVRGQGRVAGRASASAFDESEPEVRVRIDTTGVFELTYEQLAAKGYPTLVPVNQVSVHRHEYLYDLDPSYETIELPCEVDEASPANGTFDAGDRVIVYVQSWADRTNPPLQQRVWGDGEVIFVTRMATGGRRVQPRLGWLGLIGQTPLSSYPWTQRWEKNLNYYGSPGVFPAESTYDQFNWTGSVSYYFSRDTIQFETNHIDPNHPIDFTIAWQGRRNGAPYYTWGLVRNENFIDTPVADSIGWSGKANLVVSATLPGDALSEGLTNALVQYARSASSPPSQSTNSGATVMLNWFRATYWRNFRALRNVLACSSADATGPFEALATGFSDSSALRAYDVTDPQDPRRLTNVLRERIGNEYALRFQDDATGGTRRYAVFSRALSVPASQITPVTRGRLTSRTGDYLILVPEAWQTTLNPLVALRQSQGHNVLVCPVEAVYDEFNGGRRSANAIKSFIRYALNTWGAQFVLLAGDGSEDPQNFLREAGPDIIPIQRMPGPVPLPPEGREIVPSDGWYVWCLNGCNFNPNIGPEDPPLPELFIGRLPVNSQQDLADYVAKLVSYEDLSGDKTWRNRHVLLSDDMYSAGITFPGSGGDTYCERFYEARFKELNEKIRNMILFDAGLLRSEVEHFDLGWWLRDLANDGGSPPCRPDVIAAQNATRHPGGATMALFSRLSEGRMWWNYQGHANQQVLAHEHIYRNIDPQDDDKQFLMNTGKPFLFTAFSCHANAFGHVLERRYDFGPALGEEMTILPGRGAVASWASVGYEIIPGSNLEHVNIELARRMFVDPPPDTLTQFRDIVGGAGGGTSRVILGEVIALALLDYLTPGDQVPSSESGLTLSYTLLGDPGTRLSIGLPQAIVTANGDTVISDRPVSLAPPRDTLHLEAELVSNVEIRSIAVLEGGSAGSRIIPDSTYTITPAFPDTAPASLGGRRYHLSYTTPVRSGVVRYTLRTEDRYGVRNDFNVLFPFSTQLLVSDNRLAENDAVTPNADLSLKVLLPTPIVDPQAQLAVEVDSLPQPFTASALDTTGRSWQLRWTHDPYAAGNHIVELTADSLRSAHHFRVVDQVASGEGMLQNVLAFPNPFDIGSAFSYYLLSDGPADVMLRVYTVTGRLVFQRVERSLPPGYHQYPWNGLDAEGEVLANGVYLYKLIATTGTQSDKFEGRLVKLRKPRRGDVTTQ